jgi:hypothetical protein
MTLLARRPVKGDVQRPSHDRDLTRSIMAGYLRLGEVNTWYDEHGSGEPLVLLLRRGTAQRWRSPKVRKNVLRPLRVVCSPASATNRVAK